MVDLARQDCRRLPGVRVRHAYEHDQARPGQRPDGHAIDGDARLADALDYGSHEDEFCP